MQSARIVLADEALASKFIAANKGALKGFDPVADALKAEGLKGKELKQKAAAIKQQMGQAGQPTQRHHANHPRRTFHATPTPKQLQRMAQAARNNAYYAQMEAAGWASLVNWNAASNAAFASIVPHY